MLERILMSSQSSRKSRALEKKATMPAQQDKALPEKNKLIFDEYKRMKQKFESKESLTCEKVGMFS